ncbi:hypothetical protein ACFFRR_003157 [Megaselia abdita]
MKRSHSVGEELLCRHCFQAHLTAECSESKIIACRTCLKLNVHTSRCNCDLKLSEPPKDLRFVGDYRAPRPYIDVTILHKTFQALVNTGSENSSVNLTVVNWVKSQLRKPIDHNVDQLELSIVINEIATDVECAVILDQEDDVHIGTHFLHFHGYQLGFNGIHLDSSKAPIAVNKNEISFVYNLPNQQHLRQLFSCEKIETWKLQQRTKTITASFF